MAFQSRRAGGDWPQIVPSLRAARMQVDGGIDDSKQNSKAHADHGIILCWILREPPHPFSPRLMRQRLGSGRVTGGLLYLRLCIHVRVNVQIFCREPIVEALRGWFDDLISARSEERRVGK